MAIPDFQTIMLPLLKFAGDDEEHSLREAYEAMADEFNLTDEERTETVPSGRVLKFNDRVVWVRDYLLHAGLLEWTDRAHFRITEQGREVLSDPPDQIKIRFLGRIKTLLYNSLRRIFIEFMWKIVNGAYSVLYYKVLVNHFKQETELKIKTLRESAKYVTEYLISGESKTEGYDKDSIQFGEKVYEMYINNEEIKRTLACYLNIKLYFCDHIIREVEEAEKLNQRLDEIEISERIENANIYMSTWMRLSREGAALQGQIKLASKRVISDTTLKLLGAWNLSFRLLAFILVLAPSVYLSGSFIYVHILLSEFGLDSSNFVMLTDYLLLALPKLFDLIPWLIIGHIIILRRIYTETNRFAMESEYGEVLFAFHIKEVIFIVLWVLSFYFLYSYYSYPNYWYLFIFPLVFYGFSIFLKKIAYKRIFVGQFSVQGIMVGTVFIMNCMLIVAGFIIQAYQTAENAKSTQTIQWRYSIGTDELTSDEYSMVLESSKYVIFYHRGGEITRIVPVSDVREIVTHAPRE